jgi:hypothetical protein
MTQTHDQRKSSESPSVQRIWHFASDLDASAHGTRSRRESKRKSLQTAGVVMAKGDDSLHTEGGASSPSSSYE